MLTETDDEALEAESRANALLDAATAYEAGVWRDLQGGRQGAARGGPSRNARKWCRCRRGSRNERGWCARYAFTEADEGPVWRWRVRAGAGGCAWGTGWRQGEEDHRGLGLGLMSFPSNCRHHHIPFLDNN